MKFHCSRTALTEAVMNVSRMIPAKSAIPALEGIKLTAHSNQTLTLTGYDMEAGITTQLAVEVERPGEIVLTARLFLDMIRKMGGNDITIDVGEKHITKITGGMTEFNILGIPSEEFPELPNIEEDQCIALTQGSLKSMIDQTLFAVAITDTKPVHMGSLFDIKDSTITLVSVDGYRLALRKEPIESDQTLKFVVPGKVLSEISKMIKDDTDDTAEILVSSRHIIFKIGNYAILSRLLEGDFLDYQSSIPTGNLGTVTVSVRAFMDSIERASLLISDRLRSPLRVEFQQESQIIVQCSTSLGKFYDKVESTQQGESVEIGFNNKYLLDALRATATDLIRVELNGSLSPIKILPMEGDHFLFLVLPVRLKND